MALFRLPSSAPALVPRGHGLLLRAPEMSDFLQWRQLREHSRAYLTPWEPMWPSDDLTRAGFRRRLRRYAEDIAGDRSYPFIVFRESDGIMSGWGHARQCPSRHSAGRHHRILDRPALCGARLYDRGAAGAASDPVRRTEPASHRGCLHSQQYAVHSCAGKVRLHAGGVGAPLSLHQRNRQDHLLFGMLHDDFHG